MHALVLSIALISPLFDGGLPWPIPALPVVPTATAPALTLDDVEHSDDFEDRQTDIEDQVNGWTEPLTSVNETLGVWFGDDGALPDASEGDFTVGITAIDDIGSLYEFANWLGEQIGVGFEYLRVIAALPGTVMSVLLVLAMACATILLLIKMFTFGLSIFDAAWSLGNTIVQTIMEIVPL